MNLLFATANPFKIAEAQQALKPFDIQVESVKLDIDEIQHGNPLEIAKAKAKSAYALAQKPVLVSDTAWHIPALKGFPGGYMKEVSAWFTPEDWLNLVAPYEDRTIECHEYLAYYDGVELTHFSAVYKGTFASEPIGDRDKYESIELVVMMYGDKTIAEQASITDVASAGEDLEHWRQFGEWYTQKN